MEYRPAYLRQEAVHLAGAVEERAFVRLRAYRAREVEFRPEVGARGFLARYLRGELAFGLPDVGALAYGVGRYADERGRLYARHGLVLRKFFLERTGDFAGEYSERVFRLLYRGQYRRYRRPCLLQGVFRLVQREVVGEASVYARLLDADGLLLEADVVVRDVELLLERAQRDIVHRDFRGERAPRRVEHRVLRFEGPALRAHGGALSAEDVYLPGRVEAEADVLTGTPCASDVFRRARIIPRAVGVEPRKEVRLAYAELVSRLFDAGAGAREVAVLFERTHYELGHRRIAEDVPPAREFFRRQLLRYVLFHEGDGVELSELRPRAVFHLHVLRRGLGLRLRGEGGGGRRHYRERGYCEYCQFFHYRAPPSSPAPRRSCFCRCATLPFHAVPGRRPRAPV